MNLAKVIICRAGRLGRGSSDAAGAISWDAWAWRRIGGACGAGFLGGWGWGWGLRGFLLKRVMFV
jgi:hypothetical protein